MITSTFYEIFFIQSCNLWYLAFMGTLIPLSIIMPSVPIHNIKDDLGLVKKLFINKYIDSIICNKEKHFDFNLLMCTILCYYQ